MTELALAYRDLKDIDEVAPLGRDDQECIEELRSVLARHNKLDRFGLTLLHTHFAIHDDEMLVESCDGSARELLMRVVRKDDYTNPVVQTSWRLTDGAAMTSCVSACVVRNGKHHPGVHTQMRPVRP